MEVSTHLLNGNPVLHLGRFTFADSDLKHAILHFGSSGVDIGCLREPNRPGDGAIRSLDAVVVLLIVNHLLFVLAFGLDDERIVPGHVERDIVLVNARHIDLNLEFCFSLGKIESHVHGVGPMLVANWCRIEGDHLVKKLIKASAEGSEHVL